MIDIVAPASGRLWRLFLADFVAFATLLGGAGTVSATTGPHPGNRVGSSTLTVANVVGVGQGITAGQRLGRALPQAEVVLATGVAAETAPVVPRFVASKQGIIDTEAPALNGQIGDVVESMRSTGAPPPGVRQGGLPGKPGVYGNRSGALPTRPEGYYSESDVWPGTGPRGTERVVTGGPVEAWYSP